MKKIVVLLSFMMMMGTATLAIKQHINYVTASSHFVSVTK